jgi:FtsP/CotA-like multicopper oxidase with cupredoxin domain
MKAVSFYRRLPHGLAAGAVLLAALNAGPGVRAQIPGGSLDPTTVSKYQAPMVIPPAMPRSGKIAKQAAKNIDYYEIAVRQFQQQILPPSLPPTTVWSYGAVDYPGTVAEGGTFNYPAFTIEAKWNKPVRVKWINDLVDADGNYLPHLLPVDQTLHWANPVGDCKTGPARPDCTGTNPAQYTGPVPMVVHVHGAETHQESDGYPEAWYLPAANDIPPEVLFTGGTFYDTFKASSPLSSEWAPGSAVFEYPNSQYAATLWYHDHTLGMTRQNVYAGPAGFYLLRGGPSDEVIGTLPGPGPSLGDPPNRKYFDIPIAIQDRSFNADGSLFYPDNRAFFEGLDPNQLQIPFIPHDVVYPDSTNAGPSDVSPIWNPEFFGNMMVVNGNTWPYLEVEQRRYRLRLLNGCNSRFLILKMSNGLPFWQIGAEQGFLPEPVMLDELLMGPAERADVIVDFSDVPAGTEIVLLNLGPDEPFGGGTPGIDFEPADPNTTGQVMQFRVVRARGKDRTTPPQDLILPDIPKLGYAVTTRQISLNEEESANIKVSVDEDGNVVLDQNGEVFGPVSALLGTVNPDGSGNPLLWSDDVTENPGVGDTEMWEIFNYTMDGHPIHIHLVQFEVVNRESLLTGEVRGPEAWETGYKDTVIAYPDEITRVKAKFNLEGLFVWHCHILEHEDNEMMRPYCVGDCPLPLAP